MVLLIFADFLIVIIDQSIKRLAVACSPYPLSLLPATGFYGIGNWRDLTGPGDVLIENSSPGAFGSHPWINRSKKITGFIFTFILSTGNISADVPNIILQRICSF